MYGPTTSETTVPAVESYSGWFKKWYRSCSAHLSEDDLKLFALSAALLPPLPSLTSYQGDVVALQEQQRSGWGRKQIHSVGTESITSAWGWTHNNLDVSIFELCSSLTSHVGNGIFKFPTIRTNLQDQKSTKEVMSWKLAS